MRAKLLNQLSKNKKVKYSDDSTIEKYPIVLKKILSLFDRKSSVFDFHSDDSCLAFLLGICQEGIIKMRHEHYFLEALNKAFGTSLEKDDLYEPLKKILPKLNRKLKVFKRIKTNPFLGILSLEDENKNPLTVDYILSIKGQVDYFSGFIFGKKEFLKDSDGGQLLLKDHFNMLDMVYGRSLIKRYELKTLEGDILVFQNILEVCNWLTARASNYVPGRKESW